MLYEVITLESQAETDYAANLNSLLDGSCDIIITVGFLT